MNTDSKSDSGDDAKEAKPEAEDAARVSPTDLDLGDGTGGRSEEDNARVRVSEESSDGNVDKETESKVESGGGGGGGLDYDEDDVFDIGRVEIDDQEEEDSSEAQNEGVDLLSEFDDYVANEKDGMALGTSRALSYGFEVGDMVWGKVKSHPWWPGHIFNEAFATPQVRRTRREGHVLVAFFGDSSYGWFDPAELIPFEPHFAEKSKQTNYRNFNRAVEEAVDEVSRRCGVGFVCKCRNPYNFRGTNVPGYFVVDVPDYEHGAVYSMEQIRKARDEFDPREIVGLLKQLASSLVEGDQKSLSFIKNKATLFAHRKAVFEEYDETYAQAFGARSSTRNAVAASDQPVKPRAPLSGPLVIAEALGGRKGASKPTKVKDHSKKDKYLFKRRDEANNVKPHKTTQGQAGSSAPSAFLEGSIAVGDGDYMLQKRAPSASMKPQLLKHEQTESVSRDATGEEPASLSKVAANSSLGSKGVTGGEKLSLALSLDKESGALLEVKEGLTQNEAVGPTSTDCSDLLGEGTKQSIKDETSQSLKQEGEGPMEVKYEGSAKMSGSDDNLQPLLSFPKKVEEGNELNEVHVGPSAGDSSPIKAKSSAGKKAIGGVKKAKVLKRPPGDVNPENSIMGDKKKKKRKKQLGSETSFGDAQRTVTSGKVSSLVGNKKDVAVNNDLSESVGVRPILTELELPQLVRDLQALALDPFHGREANGPAIVRQFFLQFRALVYQKSLVLSPPSETELVEGRSSKTPSGVKASEISPQEPVRDVPSSKAAKPLFRSDDRTIAGRKRPPSDRQGEIAAKKSKKMSDLKSLAAERKIGQKGSDTQRGEVKETAVPIPRKSLKPGLVKRMEPPPKVVEPTMLVMKFPPKISLPSPAELKARFARFGPMDQSGLRVFYKSSTCRVVFLYKADAQAALKFATSNNSFFGNVAVRFQLREVDGPEVPASGKGYGDDNSNETLRAKDSAFMPSPALKQRQQPSLLPSGIQPKSILKKSSGDEPRGQVTGGNGNSKGTARVKFMLGGEEPSRNEQLMMPGNRNNNFNNNSASFADDGAPSSTSVAMMNYNARNFQKVTPPASSLPPILSLPHSRPPSTQYEKLPPPPPHNNFSQQHTEMRPPPPSRNSHNIPHTAATFPSAPTVDISQQMLSLLTRCNDVVSNVQGFLGYVPYHPL